MSARRVVVTGAASGIGRSVAELAVERGDSVLLVDRDESGTAAATESLAASARGNSVVDRIVVDLSETAAAERVMDKAVEAIGGCDVLISNAGVPHVAPMSELTADTFDQAIALNTRAHFLLAREAYPLLKAVGGNIVFTASTCAHSPSPPLGSYSIAKAGTLMLMRQLALEWGPDRIRCNSVSPGPTKTGLTAHAFNDPNDDAQRRMREYRESFIPLRKVGEPYEVANAIMFLASPEASQITGIDVVVDGGLAVSLQPATGVGTDRQPQP